jgi:uncharacterized protein (DUF2384 family)
VNAKLDALVQQIFNADTVQVTSAILERQPLTSITRLELTAKLAALLELPTSDINAFLESQPSQAAETDLSVETLHRTLALLELHSRVSSLIGEAAAQAWLVSQKRALDGARPLDYLRSRVGAARLEMYLGALEDGAYL